MTEEQMSEKERKKIEKADKKRKEEMDAQEAEDQQEPSDQDSNDDEMESCNAPSTRKSKSVEYDDTRSPFHENDVLSFDDHGNDDNDQEETKEEADDDDNDYNDHTEKKQPHVEKTTEKAVLKVPASMGQLERDLKSMKDDFDAKRDYLRNIDPSLLKSIIKSSIEIDTIIDFCEIFNRCSEEWINSNLQFLISFLQALTKLDRFGMAVEF